MDILRIVESLSAKISKKLGREIYDGIRDETRIEAEPSESLESRPHPLQWRMSSRFWTIDDWLARKQAEPKMRRIVSCPPNFVPKPLFPPKITDVKLGKDSDSHILVKKRQRACWSSVKKSQVIYIRFSHSMGNVFISRKKRASSTSAQTTGAKIQLLCRFRIRIF